MTGKVTEVVMSGRGNQNGPQPPLPTAPSGSSESQPENKTKTKRVCRDFVWGVCTKNAICRYRHELVVDEMKKILKFCHDYQNRNGCTRNGCTYLHATKAEQKLFLATGQLPRVLAERHAAMSASTFSSTNVVTVPQILVSPTPATPVLAAPSPPPTPTPAPATRSILTLPLPSQHSPPPPPLDQE